MKVLFYGGCHAAALRRVFETFGEGVERVDHLTNFLLIRDKVPVPYADFAKFDWVVFSPIRNKAEYNTSHLEEYLSARGIRFLKFPWLQWEGYFPTVRRSRRSWYSGWWYGGLEAAAREHASFESFCAAVFEGDLLREEALRHIEATSGKLRETERDCDLTVTDFVLERFRHQRLFLTPDHATTDLYRMLVAGIAARLDVRLDPSFAESTTEVQEGISLPILPSVRRALGIAFPGGDFTSHLDFGDDVLPLRRYLKLYYYADQVKTATASANSRVYLSGDPGAEGAVALPVRLNDVLLLRPVDGAAPRGYRRFDVLAVARGGQILRRACGRIVTLYDRHWVMGDRRVTIAEDDEKTTLDPAADLARA